MGNVSKPNTFSANTTISSSEVNSNFDTIYNEFNGSVDATNLAADAVTTAKIADANVTTAKLADDAVTPDKRSSGFDMGTLTISSGNVSVSGLGFQPKMVEFVHLRSDSTSVASSSHGGTDGTTEWATSIGVAAGSSNSSTSSVTDGCILVINTGGTVLVKASIVSLDSDGFTINFSSASTTYGATVGYRAYA